MGLKETISRKIFINLMEKSVYAYHGSPYKFDKFDLSKIGTGEGAQAFGWGLYFTDLESIARHYAKTLAKTNVITLEEFMVNNNVETVYEQYILKKYIDNYQDIDKTIEAQKKELQREKEKLTKVKKGDEIYDTSLWSIEDYIERTLGNITFSENVVKILEGVQQNLKNRNLYKVTLHKGKNPDQYTWLEWDKPISEKNLDKAISLLRKEKKATNLEIDRIKINKNGTGHNLYNSFMNVYGSQKQASLALLRAGIDGIKYPAESIARGATSDTARGYNYVVFDENAVTIDYVREF
jgi:hypothetical protein